MGKKMKLPFLSKNTEASRYSSSSSSTWPWPSCSQPRTLSFRAGNDIFKTINSAYFDTSTTEVIETPDSFFTNSSESCPSFSTASDDSGLDPVETVIKGLRSERLFFEPKAGETSSIVMEEEAKGAADGEELNIVPFKESVVLSMDSPDPILDFRKSMEEMVEAHGLKDWDHLEELLCWYLRVNAKSNHGYIVGAFVDLLSLRKNLKALLVCLHCLKLRKIRFMKKMKLRHLHLRLNSCGDCNRVWIAVSISRCIG
ncbi:hypothetical protein PRUPE_7G098500 [Prunus persica]|uniref:Transcription repressor n=1 Tax=Prunus persica TaxID=3760 RepID=A0A251N9E9_PRUPE|nr:hypothetical protein PRUPE_7G098500 [Prunus persica]